MLFVESLGLRRPTARRRATCGAWLGALAARAPPAARSRGGSARARRRSCSRCTGSARSARLNAAPAAPVATRATRAARDRARRSCGPTCRRPRRCSRRCDPRLVVYHCVDDIAAQERHRRRELPRPRRSGSPARADLVLAARRRSPSGCGDARRQRAVRAQRRRHGRCSPRRSSRGRVDPALDDAARAPRSCSPGRSSPPSSTSTCSRELARLRPEWSIVLVGPVGLGRPGHDVSRAAKRSRTSTCSARARTTSCRRSCAAPTRRSSRIAINELTASVFPMKVYEYLAAGLPGGVDAAARARGGRGDRLRRRCVCNVRTARTAARRGLGGPAQRAFAARVRALVGGAPDRDRRCCERAGMATLIVAPYTPADGTGRSLRTIGVARALARSDDVEVAYVEFDGREPSPSLRAEPRVVLRRLVASAVLPARSPTHERELPVRRPASPAASRPSSSRRDVVSGASRE